MEIKYNTSRNGCWCLTKCPFDGGGKNVLPVHVGSIDCAKCRHFVSGDPKKQIVVCNADEETK